MLNLSDHNPKKNIPHYIHEFSEDEPDFVNERDETDPTNSKRKPLPVDHVRGCNATDFKQEIQESMNDESRKFFVEMKEEIEIKKLDDIKDYLKLLLVTLPINTFKP